MLFVYFVKLAPFGMTNNKTNTNETNIKQKQATCCVKHKHVDMIDIKTKNVNLNIVIHNPLIIIKEKKRNDRRLYWHVTCQRSIMFHHKQVQLLCNNKKKKEWNYRLLKETVEYWLTHKTEQTIELINYFLMK